MRSHFQIDQFSPNLTAGFIAEVNVAAASIVEQNVLQFLQSNSIFLRRGVRVFRDGSGQQRIFRVALDILLLVREVAAVIKNRLRFIARGLCRFRTFEKRIGISIHLNRVHDSHTGRQHNDGDHQNQQQLHV